MRSVRRVIPSAPGCEPAEEITYDGDDYNFVGRHSTVSAEQTIHVWKIDSANLWNILSLRTTLCRGSCEVQAAAHTNSAVLGLPYARFSSRRIATLRLHSVLDNVLDRNEADTCQARQVKPKKEAKKGRVERSIGVREREACPARQKKQRKKRARWIGGTVGPIDQIHKRPILLHPLLGI